MTVRWSILQSSTLFVSCSGRRGWPSSWESCCRRLWKFWTRFHGFSTACTGTLLAGIPWPATTHSATLEFPGEPAAISGDSRAGRQCPSKAVGSHYGRADDADPPILGET